MKNKGLFIFMISLVILTSCAGGRKVAYNNVEADLQYQGNEALGIAVYDQREMVLDGSRKPDFVGYTRSGAGIAYPMGTKSGENLSDAMSNSIAKSFEKKGYQTKIVKTLPVDEKTEIKTKLQATDADKIIFLTLDKYHTDCYGVTRLMYNVQAEVMDENGDVLVDKNFTDEYDVGGNVFWGPGDFKTYIPEHFKQVMETILNDEEIASAL
ncbi:MAG: hypothetical protein U9P82_12905 [Bacteroidota bacterium]|nr:hypothetical protein [Bacteroidota bacterium]